MQPIVYMSAVGRVLGDRSDATVVHVCSGNALDSVQIERQLRSDSRHDRGLALSTIKASLSTGDMGEIVRLLAVSMQSADDHRLLERSVSYIEKLVEARCLSYQAELRSAPNRVIRKFRCWWRGIQVKRVRRVLENSVDLRDSLFSLLKYQDPTLRQKVVSSLYLTNAPGRNFELSMHNHFLLEQDAGVRHNIICGLTAHKYTSGATLDIYRQALRDPSVQVREAARRGVDAAGLSNKVSAHR